MTGQRTIVEVVRDCLSILKDMDQLYKEGKLSEDEIFAIERVVQESLDEHLRPLYHKPIATQSDAGASG
jgi:hypothetical protein